MNSTIEIDRKKLQSIKTVAEKVSYSRDYITRLAREGKITAMNVGRQWFVDLDSLNNYAESASVETAVRRKQLSEERRIEQQFRSAAQEKKAHRDKKARMLNVRAASVAIMVLGFGLLGGWATNYTISTGSNFLILAKNILSTPQPQSQFGLLGDREEKESGLAVASVDTKVSKEEQISVSSVKPIGDDIENGVLLLPQGSLSASTTEMFSDNVEVLTASNGSQMVVRVDEAGRPVGNVIPFVVVPVKYSDI